MDSVPEISHDLEKEREIQAELSGKSYAYIIDPLHRWSKWAAPKTKSGEFDNKHALTGPDLIDYVNKELFPYLRGFKARAEHPDTDGQSHQTQSWQTHL